jgi:uncharacterized membrane protein YkvA (DUF1232 family)
MHSKPEQAESMFFLPDIFRAIGPSDDVVVSTEKLYEWHEQELQTQHNQSRAMAYEDVATKAGSGNQVRIYASLRAEELRKLSPQPTVREDK